MNSDKKSPKLWFRLYSEAIDDEKLRLLAFEDRWHFVALLCCKAQGILDEESSGILIKRKVAVKLGLDKQSLDEVARRLSELDLIDEKSLQPKAWNSRQFESDTSKERTKAYRERKKRHSDDDVTSQERHRDGIVTVQETEADSKTDSEPKVVNHGVERTRKSRAARKCPENFRVTDEMKDWAKEKVPLVDVALATESFKDYTFKNSIIDWQAAWRNWLRKDQQAVASRHGSQSKRRVPEHEDFSKVDYGKSGKI